MLDCPLLDSLLEQIPLELLNDVLGVLVGAFQIKGDQVNWLPAVDVSRIILMGQVGNIAALVIRSIRP